MPAASRPCAIMQLVSGGPRPPLRTAGPPMSHQAEPARLPPAEVSTGGADRTVSRADFDPFHQDYRSRLLPLCSASTCCRSPRSAWT